MHPNTLYELSVLDDHILNRLNPGTTNTNEFTDEKLEQYISLIKLEGRECRWKILKKARSLLDKGYVEIFIQNHQEQLCFLIDQLYFYRENFPGQLSPRYINCLKIIEQVLTEIVKSIQDQCTNHFNFIANVTVISQLDSISHFKNRLDKIHSSNLNIDIELLTISVQPVYEFIENGTKLPVPYQVINYFDELLTEIESLDASGIELEKLLIDALFRLNFNSCKFFKYLTIKIQGKLEEEESVNIKQLILLRYLKEFNQIYEIKDIALKPRQLSIKEQIIAWLSEEIEYIEKEMRLQAISKKSGDQENPLFKIQTDMSVAQLGYFMKLLVETGIIKNHNQRELIRYFSQNFSSKQAETISQISLTSKYYNHEESTKMVVKDYLIRMVNEATRKT